MPTTRKQAPGEHIETIDGTSVQEAAWEVDLSIACSPVVLTVCRDDPATEDIAPPLSVLVDLDLMGRGYYQIGRAIPEWLTAETVRTARARYLLLRAFYWKRLSGLPDWQQEHVARLYHLGGMWRPEPGSELAERMGLTPPTAPVQPVEIEQASEVMADE